MTAVRALLDKLRTAGVTERADVVLARGNVPFVASQRVLTESVQRVAEMLADAIQADVLEDAARADCSAMAERRRIVRAALVRASPIPPSPIVIDTEPTT